MKKKLLISLISFVIVITMSANFSNAELDVTQLLNGFETEEMQKLKGIIRTVKNKRINGDLLSSTELQEYHDAWTKLESLQKDALYKRKNEIQETAEIAEKILKNETVNKEGLNEQEGKEWLDLVRKNTNGTISEGELEKLKELDNKRKDASSTINNRNTQNDTSIENVPSTPTGTVVYDATEELNLENRKRELEKQMRKIQYEDGKEIPEEVWKEYNDVNKELEDLRKSNPNYKPATGGIVDSSLNRQDIFDGIQTGDVTEETLRQYKDDGLIDDEAYEYYEKKRKDVLEDKKADGTITEDEQKELDTIDNNLGASSSDSSSDSSTNTGSESTDNPANSSESSNSKSQGIFTNILDVILKRADYRAYRARNGQGWTYDQKYGNYRMFAEEIIAFCFKRGGTFHNSKDWHVDALGIVPEVRNGQRFPTDSRYENYSKGDEVDHSETVMKYYVKSQVNTTQAKQWAVAYVLSHCEENTDPKGEVQKAYWAITAQGEYTPDNDLAKEAREYAEYRNSVEAGMKDGKIKVEDDLTVQKVAFDGPGNEIIIGPISLNYNRGFAKVGNREKVDFGGIGVVNKDGTVDYKAGITLYDQNNEPINPSAWKITYDSQHNDTRKARPAGDENYGTEGLDGFFEFPYPEEQFNIVLDYTKVSDVTDVKKIGIKYFDTKYEANYQKLDGKYKNVTWHVTYKEKKDEDGDTVKYDFQIYAKTVDETGQPLDVTVDYSIIRTGYEYEITPRNNYVPKLPPPSINIPDWPPLPPPPLPPPPPPTPPPTTPPTTPPIPPTPTPTPTPLPTPTPEPTPTPTPTPGVKIRIKIAGIVWEDIQHGKESQFNSKIDNDENGVQYVKVTLYKINSDGSKTIAQEGSEVKQNPVYTDGYGTYLFEDVAMGKYDVAFGYDGMNYTTVEPLADNGDASSYMSNPKNDMYRTNSKAVEVEDGEEGRTTFNAKFEEITGVTSYPSNANMSYGTAYGSQGSIPLSYYSNDGKSELITHDSTGRVLECFEMTARTSNIGLTYPFKERYVNDSTDKQIDEYTYESTEPYMYYVNMGLKKRPDADFAVMKDVSTATVTINKKQMTYIYGTRQEMVEGGADVFDIIIKRSDMYAKNISYNRDIFRADYKFRLEDYSGAPNIMKAMQYNPSDPYEAEMKVFVRYFMTIRNQSGTVSGKITELVDYFDDTFKYPENKDVVMTIQDENGVEHKDQVVAKQSYYIKSSDGSTGNIEWKDMPKYAPTQGSGKPGFNTMYTTSLENEVLQPGEDLYIFVTFEVDKNDDRSVKIGEQAGTDIGEKNNFVEISSFTTLDSNGNLTGQVDADSAPGNLNPYNAETYEDDSDSAPTIDIRLSEDTIGRKLNGIVWEDERTKTLNSGRIVGDGIYKDNEKPIDGVVVKLVQLVDDGTGNIGEYTWQQMESGGHNYQVVQNGGSIGSGTPYEEIKDGSGEYRFHGYIPGDYIVKFVYGENDSSVGRDRYNHDGISYNGQDYKSTAYQEGNTLGEEWYDLSSEYLNGNRLSDARDNEDRRLKVIDYSRTMKYDIAEVLYSPRDNPNNSNLLKELYDNTSMFADTAKIKVEVEFDTTVVTREENENLPDYHVRNIDFGLEQRPLNDMKLTKEIIGIRITTADENILVDTENGIRKNVNWIRSTKNAEQTEKGETTKYRNSQGKIHIYMDEEVMQGTKVQIKYKITVENTGEVDTMGEDGGVGLTYYTGKDSSDKIVTTSYDKIIDYVDNSLAFRQIDNPEDWKLITDIDTYKTSEGTMEASVEGMKQKGYLKKGISVTQEISQNNTIKPVPISQVLQSGSLEKFKLEPGKKASVELLLTKTISAQDEADDLSFDNMAEIIQFTNDVGRKANIPGNTDPSTRDSSEGDTDETETVIITPPTGENRATYYLLIGAGVLVIVAGGIFFIRKKYTK